MSETPRDPRQLARDILSGKVKIEDLARQRGMAQPPRQQQPAARVPDKIPLPRPAAPRPTPQKRAVPPRQVPPPRQVLRPASQAQTLRQPPPVRAAQPPRNPPGTRNAPQRPMPAKPAALPSPIPASAYALPTQAPSAMSILPKAPETMASALALKVAPVRTTVQLAQLMRGKDALKNGILLSEVLGKPIALRDL